MVTKTHILYMVSLFTGLCFGLLVLVKQRAPTSLPSKKVVFPTPFENAQAFDRLIKGKMSDGLLIRLVTSCRSEPERNVFCYSILRHRGLLGFLRSRSVTPFYGEPKAVVGITPQFNKEGVANWQDLRMAQVPRLLKGLESLPKSSLQTLAVLAMKESKCPNRIALAVAATLENFLPHQSSLNEIAPLYTKGGICYGSRGEERENFLTRAALMYHVTQNYKESLELLDQVVPTDAFIGRTRYWKYRNYLKLSRGEDAKKAYDELLASHPFSFHTIAAITLSGQIHPATQLSDFVYSLRRSKRSQSVNRILEQVETLAEHKFLASASQLAAWGFHENEDMEAGVKLYLARYADANTKVRYLPMVLHANPKILSFPAARLLYPEDHLPLFQKNAFGMDPHLLLAIARKESQFKENSVSPADARGLIQVHPLTARFYSAGHIPNLADPGVNVSIGAHYLSDLLARLDGNLPLSIASYNAGEMPVFEWKKRFPLTDPMMVIDLIPYRETRNYVASVLHDYYWYLNLSKKDASKLINHLRPKSLLQRLAD